MATVCDWVPTARVRAEGVSRTNRPVSDPPCFRRTVAVFGNVTAQAERVAAAAGWPWATANGAGTIGPSSGAWTPRSIRRSDSGGEELLKSIVSMTRGSGQG